MAALYSRCVGMVIIGVCDFVCVSVSLSPRSKMKMARVLSTKISKHIHVVYSVVLAIVLTV